MNSRAYQFQLQAAEAAAADPVVHAAAEDGEPKITPKAPPLLKIEAQGTSADESAPPRHGSGLAPTTMGAIGDAAEATATATKCPECPKWFASEKAMFGHLRKHPERGYKGATRPAAAAKWFASEKAMFGHLRKHPERGYKGATRPAAAATAGAAAAAVAGDNKKPTKTKVPRKETCGVVAAAAAASTKPWEEAELSTKWWPASAKRGRTPVAPVVQPASSCSEDEEAAMTLLQMASSGHTSSETHQQSLQSVEPPARALDAAAVSGHQIQTSVAEEEAMVLDRPAAHPTPEAEHQIVVQPENALELSAESQTTPAVKQQQVTDLVITTEAVLIVVPAASSKPAIVFPSVDSGAGDKKQATKKQRRVANPAEQTAAASTTPPPTAAPEAAGAVDVARTPPPARRIPSPASDKKHPCLTCGKSFPTHQALGGHVANHVRVAKTSAARPDDLAAAHQAMRNILARRDKKSAGKSNGNGKVNVTIPASAGALQECQDAQPPPVPEQAEAPAPTPTPQAAAPHVCDACHLIFPSGQALGGHKRKHWFPEKQQAKAAPAPALRDFDLNEMPEEEGQGENNNQP